MVNFICSICREHLLPSGDEDVYALSCGHVFHDKCIRIWLRGNQTCPGCRHPYRKGGEVKLYFETEDSYLDESVPGVSELKYKYESAVYEIKTLKEKSLIVANEVAKLTHLNEKLRAEIRNSREEREKFRMSILMQTDELKKAVEQRKAQSTLIHNLVKERDNCQLDLAEAKKEIAKLSGVKQILMSNSLDTKDGLFSEFDPTTLQLLLTSFKRDLISTQKNEQILRNQLRMMHAAIKDLDKKKNDLSERLSLKEKVIDVLKQQLTEENVVNRSCDPDSDADHSKFGDFNSNKSGGSPKRDQNRRGRVEEEYRMYNKAQSSPVIDFQVPSTSGTITTTTINIAIPSSSRLKRCSMRDLPTLKRQREENQSSNYDGFGGRSNTAYSHSHIPQLKSGRFVCTQQPLIKRRK
uniref:Unkown protein n=1 Tax=Riptortus pedestris TaxID=329032 RepID=R4WR00_RIPPE|nr:unkown protein [Riptortus pedestris]